MNQYLSEKIKIISFFCIILVLYIHSNFHESSNEIGGMAFNLYLQNAISRFFTRFAVPMFYAISGFLFFFNIQDGISDIYRKMRKRMRTLLIPYLIACLFFPLFFILIQQIPFAHNYINSTTYYTDSSLLKFLKDVFIDNGQGHPIAFHLWFLKNLIIIVVLSPVLYYLRQKAHPLLLLTVIYLASIFIPYINLFRSLFFFLLGSYYKQVPMNKETTLKGAFVLFLIGVIEIVYPGSVWKYLQIPIMTLGVITFWGLYDIFIRKDFNLDKCKFIKIACSFTFFIYLFHEPALNIVRKLLVIPFGHNSFSYAFSFLLSPWVFVCTIIPIAYMLKRYLPKIYGICVGGR